MAKTWIGIALALGLAAAPAAAQADDAAGGDSSVWAQVVKIYQEARGSSEAATEDVLDWARNDLESIGDWEYKVVFLTNPNPLGLEKRLNELGTERWEVVWMDRQGANVTVTLKRTSRTWRNKLPLGQLLRLAAPGGGSGGE